MHDSSSSTDFRVTGLRVAGLRVTGVTLGRVFSRALAIGLVAGGVAAASGVVTPASVHAQAVQAPSATLRLDDGFTQFELTDHEESENGARVWRGYHVAARYRVFGPTPRGSAMLTIFKEGGREVGRVRCEGSGHDVSEDPAWAGMSFDCSDYEQRLRTIGALTAETRFIDGNTDAETVLRTHTLSVHEAAQEGLSPTHYVSRHDDVLSGILAWSVPGPSSYPVNGYFSGYTPPSRAYTLTLILPIAGDSDTESAITQSRLRCRVNGQPVELVAGDQATDTRGTRSIGVSQLQQTPDGIRPNEFWFRQLPLGLPVTFGPPEAGTVNLGAHPGRWECDFRNNGTVVRTFAFTVGADGLPAAHAEQASGLYFGPRAVLADVTVPAQGAAHERTDPTQIRAGGFHGRAWTTDAMRAAAAAVPALGTPHLVPPGRAAAPAGRAAPAAAAARRRR